MKLSKVYSNITTKFTPIIFKPGFNVLLARVTRPKDSAKDSHNLGKTILINLLDFLLLSGLSKGHFLHDHNDIFKRFVFFLELELNSGTFVTVCRSVEQSSKASFKQHDERDQDFSNIGESEWNHYKLPFQKAREQLILQR